MVIEVGIPKKDLKNSGFHATPTTQPGVPNHIKQA